MDVMTEVESHVPQRSSIGETMRRFLRFLNRFNPLKWFWDWLSKTHLGGRFVNWLVQKVKPRVWEMIKRLLGAGTVASLGGIGAALVSEFTRGREEDWGRFLPGSSTVTQQGSMFQNGRPTSQPTSCNTTSRAYYGSSQPVPAGAFPHGV